jgi:hypothetical protein
MGNGEEERQETVSGGKTNDLAEEFRTHTQKRRGGHPCEDLSLRNRGCATVVAVEENTEDGRHKGGGGKLMRGA